MKKQFFSEYIFDARHHPIQSNVYSLKLIDGYIGQTKRVHSEILRVNSWDNLEIDLNGPIKSIYPVLPGGEHYLPEMRFYYQIGNRLLGKDLETDRFLSAQLCGPVDENGICVPVSVNIYLSSQKVTYFDMYTCRSSENVSWQAA